MSDHPRDHAPAPGHDAEQEVPHKRFGARNESGTRRLRSPGLFNHHDHHLFHHRSRSVETVSKEESKLPGTFSSSDQSPISSRKRRMTTPEFSPPHSALKEPSLRPRPSSPELSSVPKSPERGRSLTRADLPSSRLDSRSKEKAASLGPAQDGKSQTTPANEPKQPVEPMSTEEQRPHEINSTAEHPASDYRTTKSRSVVELSQKDHMPWIHKSHSQDSVHKDYVHGTDHHIFFRPSDRHSPPSTEPRHRRSSSVITVKDFAQTATHRSPSKTFEALGVKPYDPQHSSQQGTPQLQPSGDDSAVPKINDPTPPSLGASKQDPGPPAGDTLKSPDRPPSKAPPTPILKPQCSRRELPVAEKRPSTDSHRHARWSTPPRPRPNGGRRSSSQLNHFDSQAELRNGHSDINLKTLYPADARRLRVQDGQWRLHQTPLQSASAKPSTSAAPSPEPPSTLSGEKKGSKRKRFKGKLKRCGSRLHAALRFTVRRRSGVGKFERRSGSGF